MANQLRTSAENPNWSESNPHEESKEFFARWLHRKQENELSRAGDQLSVSRFSRLLHRLELKSEELHAKPQIAGSELRINHPAEAPHHISKSGEQAASEKSGSEEESDGIKETFFDIRHEELDDAMPKSQPIAATDEEAVQEQTSSHTNKQPIPLATILAEKKYRQTRQPSVLETETLPEKTPIKTYKAYIVYGFLAGLAGVAVLAVVSLT